MSEVPSQELHAAFQAFTTPAKCNLSPREKATLEDSTRRLQDYPGAPLDSRADHFVTYRWGGPPYVLLVHGWGGRAGQLAGLVERLRQRGLGVLAFDAPAHGESPGVRTTVFEFMDCLEAMRSEFDYLYAVGHSLGGSALVMGACQGFLELENCVLIAPNDRLARELRRFLEAADQVELYERLWRWLPEWLTPNLWSETDLAHLAPNFGARTLILHDRMDSKVPFAASSELVTRFPDAQLYGTSGLGHTALLRMPQVLERVAHHFPSSPA